MEDDDDDGGANRRVCVDGWMAGWLDGWLDGCRDRTHTRRKRTYIGSFTLEDDAGGSSIVAVRRARGRGGGS